MGMWQVRQKPPSWEVPASHPKLHSPSQPCMRRHCALMPVLSWAVHSFITPWWWAWGYRLGLHGNQETWFSYLATSHTSDLVHPQLHKGTEYGLCLCYNPKKEQLKTHASCSRRPQVTTEDRLTTGSTITASNQGPGCKFLHQLLLKSLFNSKKE